MSKNGQERSNQIADQFMRMAKRIPTKKVAITIEEQMAEIRENKRKERERDAREAKRLAEHKAKQEAERDNYRIWAAKKEQERNKK